MTSTDENISNIVLWLEMQSENMDQLIDMVDTMEGCISTLTKALAKQGEQITQLERRRFLRRS